MDVQHVNGLMRDLDRATMSLRAMYERLSRYVVEPMTRDDVARRDDLRLEIEEAETRRAELVQSLMAALKD